MHQIARWLSLATIVASPVFADIILVSPTEISGSGLGAVNTVLTLQSPANNTVETGCVGVSGGAAVTTNCGFSNFTVQNQSGAPTLAALGITSGSDIRIVFNAAEPGGALDIQLNALVLTLYNADGSVSQTHSLQTPLYFPTTNSGTGNSGFLFRLTDLEAAAAQGFITANGGLGSVRVGLGTSVGCGTANNTTTACIGAGGGGAATGGLETFFVESAASVPGGGGAGDAVPEPESALLTAMGGIALIAVSKLRRRR